MRIILLIGMSVLFTCQYPVSYSDLPETRKFMVIDAEVTEDYALVNVSYSLENVSSTGAYNLPKPPVATATIVNINGTVHQVSNTKGEPDSLFKGKIGDSYKLIVTADGRRYESTEEIMRPSAAMDTLIAQYSRESFRDPADLLYDGFDVYAEVNDIAGVENFYQWDWIHYRRAVQCNKVFDRSQNAEVYLPCFPHDCWDITYNDRVIIQTDKLRDGQALAQLVVRIPFSTPPNRYYLRVEQRSITPTVFAHLESVKSETESKGTLFDIPSQTRFSPNIFNSDDREEKIFGVFNVFSYQYKVVIIYMTNEIPGATSKTIADLTPFHSNRILSAPCTEESNRTQKRPVNWVD